MTKKPELLEQFDGYFDLEDCTLDEVRSRLRDPREYWGGDHGVAGTTQIIKQADDALTARELIKGKVLETAGMTSREAAEQIALETNSEVVNVIGSKFVLYRRNPKEPKIELPKAKNRFSRKP